jgi:hypothetical protein
MIYYFIDAEHKVFGLTIDKGENTWVTLLNENYKQNLQNSYIQKHKSKHTNETF